MADDYIKQQRIELILKKKEVLSSGLKHEADLYAKELRKWSDNNKIRPMKKLAEVGNLDHLKYILPLSQYTSDFLRKLARNAACKIIVRELRKSTGNKNISKSEKIRFIDMLISLDPSYKYLYDFDLDDDKISPVLLNILAQEDKDLTVEKLGKLLLESDSHIRATAVKLISELLNSTQTNTLIKLLHDPDSRVKANVIEALESIGNTNVVGILLRYKMDKEERVRANTLKALWNLGYKDIENALSDMLFAESFEMKSSGIWVIGEIGQHQPSLKKLLHILDYEDDPAIRLKVEQVRRKITFREREIRILVIDDDKAFLRGFFQNLAADGFHIHAAFNGKSGLQSALVNKPELIMVKENLDDMDGLALISELRKEELTKRIPIILHIERAKKESINKEKLDLAVACLADPIDYRDFIEVVEQFNKI